MKEFWKKFKNFIENKIYFGYMAVALLSMVLVYCYIKEGKELPAILWTICSAVYITLAWRYYKMFK